MNVISKGSVCPEGTRIGHKRGRVVRSDALPEALEYRDTGCEVSPSCLACPLSRCRYDVPGGIRALRNEVRLVEIRRLVHEGKTADEIAEAVRISRRTVFRELSKVRRR